MLAPDRPQLLQGFLLALELQRLLLVNKQLAEEAAGMEAEIELSDQRAEQARLESAQARLQADRLLGEVALQKEASERLLAKLREDHRRELEAARADWEKLHEQRLRAVQKDLLAQLRVEVQRVRGDEKLKYEDKLNKRLHRPLQGATPTPHKPLAKQSPVLETHYTVDCPQRLEEDATLANGLANSSGKYTPLLSATKRRSTGRSVGEHSSDCRRSHMEQSQDLEQRSRAG